MYLFILYSNNIYKKQTKKQDIQFASLKMNQDEICAVCEQQFTQSNLAWIISLCGHNICNQCLKKCKSSKTKTLYCKHCNQKYNVDQQTLQQFPKNITILKTIRDSKNNSIITPQPNIKKKQQQNSQQNSMLLSQSSVKYVTSTCQKHGKPLQIICTIDRGLLCAHCALFGQHHNHTFKTLQQFNTQVKNFTNTFNQLQQKKQLSQQLIRGKKYRSSIISKITDKKDKLVIQIKDRFSKIIAAVKDAQNKIFQQLIKCFRAVDSQISKITKQQQDVDRSYHRWKKQIVDYIKLVQQVSDIKSKIQVFYRQNRPKLQDGSIYLKQIQNVNNTIRTAVEQKINSIKIQYFAGIQGYIYNFAKVQVNPNQIKIKNIHKELQGYYQIDQFKPAKKQMRIQFVKSSQFQVNKDVRKQEGYKSPRGTLNKVKSNPRLPKAVVQKTQTPKKPLTPPKMSLYASTSTNHHANLQSTHGNFGSHQSNKSAERHPHTQNLQFAQRMLYQFIQSSDTLDLTGCQLSDDQIYHIVSTAACQKPIKCLKLSKNKLSNTGLTHLVQHIACVTNLNLSYNTLTDECIDIFINTRTYLPSLRIINISHNKINERKVKNKLQELKKIGIISTL